MTRSAMSEMYLLFVHKGSHALVKICIPNLRKNIFGISINRGFFAATVTKRGIQQLFFEPASELVQQI